jgi:hypothetical protein
MSRIIKITLLFVSLAVLSIFPIACASEKSNMPSKGNPIVAKAIEEVLKERARELMSIPGVVGAGQGLCEGKPCIKVFVIKMTPDLDQKIPNTLEGYQVVVEETGEIKALPKNQD